MTPPAALKAGPITRVCHVCGRQYGLSSFEIHLKQCKKLWIAQEELKPKAERRPLPKTPPGLDRVSEAEIAVGGGAGDGKVDRDAIEAMNRAAQEAFNVHGMEKCENCGRTFAEGRLAIHSKSCRPDNVAKKVGDGAAPRNRAESQADYGRVKANASGSSINSSSDSSSATAASVKKSQARAATDSASSPPASVQGAESPSPPSVSSSSSAARALSGSIASNRKRIPAHGASSADSTADRRASRQLQTPLAAGIAESVTIEQLRDELGGKESAINVICAKLEQWEAATLATLQEIRDLKQIFSDVRQ